MGPGRERLWCDGWPNVGERSLERDEREALTRRLEHDRARLRVRRWLVGGGSVAALALSAAPVIDGWGREPIALLVFAALGLFLLALGPIGVVIDLLFGKRPVSRAVLGAGLIAVIAGGIADNTVAIGLGGAVVVLGGAAVLVAHSIDDRRLARLLRVVASDIAAGKVLRFEPLPEPVLAEPPAPPYFELLPASRVLHRFGGVVMSTWEVLATEVIAERPDATDAPLDVTPGGTVHPGFSVRQRHLDKAELAELRRLRRRLLPGIWGAAVLATIVVAACLSVLPRQPLAAATALAATLLVAGALVLRIEMFRRALGRDVRRGQALVVQRRVSARNQPGRYELLPESNAWWTVNDRPAAWRFASGG